MKFEIEPLVVEILDQLPESVWTSNSTTFFDPAIGGGQFVRAIEQRLRAHGHADSNIRRRVFGFEESDLHIRYAVNKHKLVGQYVRKPYEKFLLLDNSMKFDVVVGNPPYQSTADGSKRKKMWVKIAEKSIDIANFVAFVTPTAWQKDNAKYFNDIGQLIKSKLVTHGDANAYFSVGEDIGYWIVDKTTNNPVEIVDNNPCSPIYKKMRRKGERWHYRDFQQPYSDIDKKVFPTFPDNEFSVPIFWTAKQIRYCRPKDVKYSGWKVIVNNSGHYFSDTDPEKYSKVDNMMTVGLGAWGIKVASEEEGKNVLSWVRSKLYRVVVSKMKTGGFNNPFIELESLGTNKQWTDAEIYNYFSLTSEEIDYVEASVK
jgi:hypothetical protein